MDSHAHDCNKTEISHQLNSSRYHNTDGECVLESQQGTQTFQHLLNHRKQTGPQVEIMVRHNFCTQQQQPWRFNKPSIASSPVLPVCSPPTEPENGGYRCHPSPCPRLTQKTVIEYFCDEGYALKGDYKFLTCQNGEWDAPMQISCRLTQGISRQLPSSPSVFVITQGNVKSE